ncbi:Hsp70 family protein [Desulfobacterales bacterium HSG17]|nr:Hsp70 family protein [Desulfobacterales bacterium HSG17]
MFGGLEMSNNDLYLGIDFGTSTNYVTRWNAQKKVAVPVVGITKDHGGSNFIDNIIYYESVNSQIIGKLAFKKGITEPFNVVEGIKRKLENDNWKQRIPSLREELSAEEITTDIFRTIKNRVEEIHGGKTVDGVVISVPFAFQSKERQRIKNAAEKAGLNVMKLIEEPVAAAICFGLFNEVIKNNIEEKVLIFDLGGGTFDVTIFNLVKQSDSNIRVEVLNTDGHKTLGGKDIDDMLVRKFEENIGYELALISDERERRKDQLNLIEEAKRVKEALALAEEDDACCTGLAQGKMLEMDITLDDFNEWLIRHGFIGRIKEVLENALDEIEFEPSDIDRIVLVGGSSNIALIQEEIEKFFGKKAESIKNPGELVGEGAGIYCGSLLDKNLSYEIITKISHAIGVKTGTKFTPLIQRNSKYETFSDIRYFSIKNKTNRNTKIDVYQGNSTDIIECSFVGEIQIDGSEFPDNKIGIQLGTDKNGIVSYKLYKIEESDPFYAGRV